MATATIPSNDQTTDSILRDCWAALRSVAEYRLPGAVDRRLLWLSENKEKLSDMEQEDLLALVEMTEERTVQKVQARAVIKRLGETYPHLQAKLS